MSRCDEHRYFNMGSPCPACEWKARAEKAEAERDSIAEDFAQANEYATKYLSERDAALSRIQTLEHTLADVEAGAQMLAAERDAALARVKRLEDALEIAATDLGDTRLFSQAKRARAADALGRERQWMAIGKYLTPAAVEMLRSIVMGLP